MTAVRERVLKLDRLRELDLRAAPAPGRPRYIAAASGLVRAGSHLYVVADDENQLGIFPSDGDAPGDLLPLCPGVLPDGLAERKAHKPDLEAIVRLPVVDGYPNGALVALGSGSTPNRTRAVIIALDGDGAIASPPVAFDLAALYAAIGARLGALNIEGAFVLDDDFCVLHRGHKRDRRGACIRMPLEIMLEVIRGSAPKGGFPFDIHVFDLGETGGIPLAFTDGAALPGGRFVFTAVAEDADDSYADGDCVGAAIGIATARGDIEYLAPVEPVRKYEGIDAQLAGGAIRLLLVTDADDVRVAATLFAGRLVV